MNTFLRQIAVICGFVMMGFGASLAVAQPAPATEDARLAAFFE